MVTVPNPLARRRELGTLLRQHREHVGLSLAQAAKEILCSTATLSRIENGQRTPTPRDMRDMINVYRVTDEDDRRRLEDLAAKAREREQGAISAHPALGEYVSYEIEAVSIRDFKGSAISGLLQTEAYARAVLERYFTAAEPIVMSRLVESRLERQRVVFGRSDPPQLHAIVDEAAIRRVVGGPEVMRAQLEHLLAVGEEPHIRIQVVPFDAGAHPGMENTFTIFDLESDDGTSLVVYSEDLIGTVRLEKATDLEAAVATFEKVRELSLTTGGSADLIRKAYQELT